jgi:hypothetical protein
MTSAAFAKRIEGPQMKGIGFANVRNYVRERHGDAAWLKVLNTLPSAHREEVTSALAVGWYDVGHFAELLRAVDSVCGQGDLRLLREVGAAEAEQDLNRVLRVFLRVLTPSQIFKVEGRLWSHFQNSGTWVSSKVPGGVDATLTGWAVDEALCEELAGYLVRLVQFTGGRTVAVHHDICRAKGHPRCVFEYRFSE